MNDAKLGRRAAMGLVVAMVTAANAAAPVGRYTVSTDTVLDTKTNRTWQRVVPTATYTWANATTYCQALSLGGMTGWRLPTLKELQSLVDIRMFKPSIDAAAFPATPANYFWSSSPYAYLPSYAWVVDFSYGTTTTLTNSTTNTNQVRCVR